TSLSRYWITDVCTTDLENRIANMHRHDMVAVVDDRQAERLQPRLEDAGVLLLLVAQLLRRLDVADGGRGPRRHRRRQRRGEDEARSIGADRVHHLRRRGDVAP